MDYTLHNENQNQKHVCFWAGQIRPKETLSEAWGSAFRCCLVLNYEFLFTHIISVP